MISDGGVHRSERLRAQFLVGDVAIRSYFQGFYEELGAKRWVWPLS